MSQGIRLPERGDLRVLICPKCGQEQISSATLKRKCVYCNYSAGIRNWKVKK